MLHRVGWGIVPTLDAGAAFNTHKPGLALDALVRRPRHILEGPGRKFPKYATSPPGAALERIYLGSEATEGAGRIAAERLRNLI